MTESGTGNPVWGAEIWAEVLSDEDNETWTTTNIDGSFTLPVLTGGIEIGTAKYGYMETYSNLTVPVGGVSNYNTSLTLANTQITGTVTEFGTNSPICGAEIWVEKEEGESWNETDVDGNFTLPVLFGDIEICAEKEGYMETCINLTVPASGISNYNLSLKPGISSCKLGQTIEDPVNDVSIDHIDVIELDSDLINETLTVTFHIKDVPSVLTFNREGVPSNALEYEWSVYVDIDNNPLTGCSWEKCTGAEYSLSAMHFIRADNPITQPISDGVQVNIWEYDSSSDFMTVIDSAVLNVDDQSDTMTLSGDIPGISLESSIFFLTRDYNPGGTPEWDWSTCNETGCTYYISPTSQSFDKTGGIGSVFVTATSGCSWTATSNDSWITITSGSSGSGNGTVNYSVSASTSSRTVTMTIADLTFTVTQNELTENDPVPDIKANGSDGPITLGIGDNLLVTAALDSGDKDGEDADWWVYATSPFGTYCYTLSWWQPSNTPIRVYGGALFKLSPYTVLNMSTLPVGDYTFNFAVDDNMDNIQDNTYADKVLVTIETSDTNTLNLPDTGQTGSYTDTFGEDSDYTINPPSYTDNGNGTVTDNNTELMWQQVDDNNGYNRYEATGTSHDEYNPEGATDVCGSLTLAGYNDWRLPELKELTGIVDYGTYQPTIDETYFPNTNSSSYWSSTLYAFDYSSVWSIHFYEGYYSNHANSSLNYVRCVRGGEITVDFTDNGDGTVTDNVIGLMWQQEDDDITHEWEDAIVYCEGLSLAGYNDWRLPNIKELLSIVDDDNFGPAIDEIYFPDTIYTNALAYWSSTTRAYSAADARDVSFGTGA